MRKFILPLIFMAVLIGCQDDNSQVKGPPAIPPGTVVKGGNVETVGGKALVAGGADASTCPAGANCFYGDTYFNGSVQSAGMAAEASTAGIVLTSADWGKIVWATGAGEVQLPDGGASDDYKYIIVFNRDSGEQQEVALTDATEHIVLFNGDALTNGNDC
jgi:hypothetical protein